MVSRDSEDTRQSAHPQAQPGKPKAPRGATASKGPKYLQTSIDDSLVASGSGTAAAAADAAAASTSQRPATRSTATPTGSPILDALRDMKKTKKNQDQAPPDYFSCTVHGDRLQQQILQAVADFVGAQLRDAQETIAQQVVAELLPKLAVAAERAVDRVVEEGAMAGSAEEKTRAVLDRLQELPVGDLEGLFKQPAMINVLRRLLSKLELDEACSEWEDIGSGKN
ncbi:hypothetical protein F4780DRAFT_781734 [Xylariomycetidae sp. FL0641]|nr:hypothetical protein F4780DRAFT_781734 [Xylariomycetidae sp. FL0641]